MNIRTATTEDDYFAARGLILEYVEWLAEDFCTVGFDEEIDALPMMYGPPDGQLLLAFEADVAVACVAYRKIGNGDCEMKRLYVAESQRGRGLGRELAVRLIDEARSSGYRRMLLDSLPKLEPAIALYRDLGFVDTGDYNDNPIPDVVFMSLDLA